MSLGRDWRKAPILFKGSLRIRAIAWFFVPTAIILVAVVMVNFYSYQDVTEQLVIERGEDVPRFSASRLATDLEEYTDFLTALARDAAAGQHSPTRRQDVLDQAGGKSLVFDNGVFVLDTFGEVVATQPGYAERLGQDWSDRSYFRQMVQNQSVGYGSPDPIFTNIIDDEPRGPGSICGCRARSRRSGGVSRVRGGYVQPEFRKQLLRKDCEAAHREDRQRVPG